MKPNYTPMVTQVGNIVPVQVSKFGIDAASDVFLMNILTDLYPDPEVATIREYATNAWDAHRAAGHVEPIIVSLPSELRPVYVVTDHGVGMSYEELDRYYTKYGASTKRDSNEATGMLGLGCKAALTYATQFTVVSVKEGVKTVANVVRGEGLSVLDTVMTNERNGLEVQIPVKHVNSFNRKAEFFFKFWNPADVLVNGEAPNSVFDTENQLDDDVVVTRHVEQDYVVMGNVPYPVGRQYTYDAKMSSHLEGAYVVARVEIGSVDFTPARDSLQLTDRTKEVLKTVRDFVDERMEAKIRDDIEAAPTFAEASKRHNSWRKMLNHRKQRDWTYRGVLSPVSITITGFEWTTNSRYNRQSTKASYISQNYWVEDGTVILTGTPYRALNKAEKDHLAEMFPTAKTVYSVHTWDDGEARWIDPGKIHAWEDVKPVRVKLPRQPRTKAEKVKYALWVKAHGTWDSVATEDITHEEIVYVVRSDNGHRSSYNAWTRDQYRAEVARFFGNRFPATAVVLLGVQEVERFCKRFPQAQTVPTYLQRKLHSIEAQLTDDALAWNGTHRIFDTPEGVIFDPKAAELRRRIENVHAAEDLVRTRQWIKSTADFSPTGTWDSTEGSSDLQAMLDAWEAKYPLLKDRYGRSGHGAYTTDEADYINALYYYDLKHVR